MGLGAVGAHADDADAGLGQRLDFLDVGVKGSRQLGAFAGLAGTWPTWTGVKHRLDQRLLKQVRQVLRGLTIHFVVGADLHFVEGIQDVGLHHAQLGGAVEHAGVLQERADPASRSGGGAL